VTTGDFIGYSGDYFKRQDPITKSWKTWGGVPAHLHLEVLDENNVPRDPYGWQGTAGADPLVPTNGRLWTASPPAHTVITVDFQIHNLTVGGDYLYFFMGISGLTDDFLMKVSKNGGVPDTLAKHIVNPIQIATDGNDVYWEEGLATTPWTGKIRRISAGGGTITDLSEGHGFLGCRQGPLVLRNGYLYFGSFQDVNTFAFRRIQTPNGPL
jgi:hypothetical protein